MTHDPQPRPGMTACRKADVAVAVIVMAGAGWAWLAVSGFRVWDWRAGRCRAGRCHGGRCHVSGAGQPGQRVGPALRLGPWVVWAGPGSEFLEGGDDPLGGLGMQAASDLPTTPSDRLIRSPRRAKSP